MIIAIDNAKFCELLLEKFTPVFTLIAIVAILIAAIKILYKGKIAQLIPLVICGTVTLYIIKKPMILLTIGETLVKFLGTFLGEILKGSGVK